MKRVKRRYLAIQVESTSTLHPRALIDAIWNGVSLLYGEYGASKTNLSLIEYNSETNRAILRTSLVSLNQVRASLITITSIADTQVSLHVLAISGTIKALKKNILKNQYDPVFK